MQSKERFLQACNHVEPDRVPISLGGTAGKVYASTMLKMMDFYGIARDKIEYHPAGFKFVPFCEELYEILGVDTRIIYPNSSSRAMLEAQLNKTEFTTKWGSKIAFHDEDAEWAHLGLNVPLGGDDLSVEEVLDFPWPMPDAELTIGLRDRAKQLHDEGKYAVGVYRAMECGVFGTVHNMVRGTEQFLCDLAGDPDLAEALLDKALETQIAYYGAVLDEVGQYVDFVETEDDMGMQDRTLVSPKVYRDLIKPRQKALVQFIKSKCRPGTRVFMHSDGAIRPFIDDFIDLGVDILNPLQVGCKGMILSEIKAEFGQRLVFNGGLDVQKPFIGSPQDVKDAVKEAIDTLAPGGGYILGPTHNYAPNITIENMLTLFEFAKEYGKYR